MSLPISRALKGHAYTSSPKVTHMLSKLSQGVLTKGVQRA